MRNHRITFRRENGDTGYFYIAAKNATFAITDFMLMTGNSRASAVSVEADVSHRWIRVL